MTANNAAPAFAAIMLLTGVGIPILAALNGGLGTRLGSPMAASMILFGLAFLIATAGALMTNAIGQIRFTAEIPAQFYFGGLFVAFYVIAVTFIAPRFGVGNAIFFVLVGQLISAATIDHFGLFGAMRSAIDARRIAGIALMVAGVWLARRTS
ncbi:transporter family-2 protein [Sphingopyxis panaciterrae]|uniref:DMT family transporter n=1 Tax=Sphingopyxis panaciterrae TaxID=363841 RepID=UPI0014248BA7|nr:DMT family transporter [Sphingopyxis panaciterrae]NIJ38644.1 transporter family-2 protein [Sphingopyxis panaciterrae]